MVNRYTLSREAGNDSVGSSGATASGLNPLLWLGLCLAFSPVIYDLTHSWWGSGSTDRYALLAVVLFALAWWRGPKTRLPPRRTLGFTIVGAALLLEIGGIALASSSLARIGLPTAVIGASFLQGRPSPTIALLAYGTVPVPAFVHSLTTPWLETWLGAAAASCADLLGASVETSGPLVRSGQDVLELLPSFTGLITIVCCTELGFYRAVRDRLPPREIARLAALGGVLGIPLHFALLLGAVFALAAGWPNVGDALLRDGAWILGLIVAVTWELGRGSRAQSRVPHEGGPS